MKAWRFYAFGDMRLDELPMPVVRPGHVLAQILCIQPSVTEAQPSPSPAPAPAGEVRTAPARLLELVNGERTRTGLGPLTLRADAGAIAKDLENGVVTRRPPTGARALRGAQNGRRPKASRPTRTRTAASRKA